MIAVLRTTSTMLLLVLACWNVSTPATAAPASPAGSSPPNCNAVDLDDAIDVRAHADLVTDVFVGQVRTIKERTAVGGGQGTTDGTNGATDDPTPNDPTPDDPTPNDHKSRTVGWEHTVLVRFPFRGSLQLRDQVLVDTGTVRDDGLGKLEAGATYLFFASGDEGMDHLIAEPCSGTQPLPGGLSAGLRDSLQGILDEQPEVSTPLDYMLSTPEDGVRGTPSLGRLAAPGAALALIGVLGLLLLARIGSRRT